MAITPRQEQLAFYYELGLAITQWASVEWQLYKTTARIFTLTDDAEKHREFYKAYFSIENFRAKLKFSDTIISSAAQGRPFAEAWAKLEARIAGLAKIRNKLAHHSVMHYMNNPPGRNVALLSREAVVTPIRRGQKHQPGAIFVRDIVRYQNEFSALRVSLEHFSCRVHGWKLPQAESSEQPRNPQTIQQIVSHCRGAFEHPQKPSPRKSGKPDS